MFEKQVHALATIWKDTDIRSWSGDAVANLIKCVVLEDPEAGIATADDIKNIIVHTPTILYWDKMNRFMNGMFVDGETRVKLAEKFEDDHPKYIAFVKKQMHMINEFSDDAKIDYYARLTRCYLYTDLQDGLYLKLAKFLSMCTPTELGFLEEASMDSHFENSMMASSLYQYGLLMLGELDNGKSNYVLSDFGKALKQNSLNFDDGLRGQIRLDSYDVMTPASLPQLATNEDIERLFENQELLFDGGTAKGLQTASRLADLIETSDDGRVSVYAP